jgi:hypothetical protein
MARYQVTVDVEKGPRLDRTVRARSALAAYQSARSALIEDGVDPQARCLATVRRRSVLRRSTLVAGGPWTGGSDDGLAGVRAPRRMTPGADPVRQDRAADVSEGPGVGSNIHTTS